MSRFMKLTTSVFIFLFCLSAVAAPVQAEEKGIGRIKSFDKTPHLKSIGAWETFIRKGLPIYSGDKILSGNSKVEIVFQDDSVLTITPNSIVRLVESEGVRRKRIINREIRLLIGKIKYESGKSSRTKARVITPAAVYPVSGGISAVSYQNEAGTNDRTVVFSTNKDTGIKGDIIKAAKENDVPDATPETAKKDPNYQITLASIEAMKEYIEKKHRLEKIKTEHNVGAYEKKSRTDRATLPYDKIEEKDFSRRSIHYAYDDHFKLSGRLDEYAQASLKELIAENASYSRNPDKSFAMYSEEIGKKAEAALNRLIELDKIVKMTQKELETQKSLFDKAEKTKDKMALSYQMTATIETCSGNEKGMYAQAIVIEGLTTGTQDLKEAFEFLEPYAKTVNTFGGRFFIEDLKTLVQAVLESSGEISRSPVPYYVADAGGNPMSVYFVQKTTGKTEPSLEKLLKLIEVIGNAVSRYSGLNNLLLNAHEANLLSENSEKAEEELLAALKEWVSVFETYNNSVSQFKSLTLDQLKKALETIIEQSEKIESSDELFKAFISEYIRLSAVLSPVSGNDLGHLMPAFAAYIRNQAELNCRKCDDMQTILQEQQKCLDLPQCYRCNPQGQLVPDNGAFCDDGDPCTRNDRCVGGICRGIRILSAEDPNCR